jgi:predicted RNase H-like HicB family nuclease
LPSPFDIFLWLRRSSCVAVGETLEEAVALIKGAIELHLEGMREDGDPIPVPSTTAAVIEVAA